MADVTDDPDMPMPDDGSCANNEYYHLPTHSSREEIISPNLEKPSSYPNRRSKGVRAQRRVMGSPGGGWRWWRVEEGWAGNDWLGES